LASITRSGLRKVNLSAALAAYRSVSLFWMALPVPPAVAPQYLLFISCMVTYLPACASLPEDEALLQKCRALTVSLLPAPLWKLACRCCLCCEGTILALLHSHYSCIKFLMQCLPNVNHALCSLCSIRSKQCAKTTAWTTQCTPATTSTNGVDEDFSSLLVSWPLLAGSPAADNGCGVFKAAAGVFPAGGLLPMPGVLDGVLLGKDEPFGAFACFP